MEPTTDPSKIPPPLRSQESSSKVSAANATTPLDTDIGRIRPDISGMIAAVAALMLVLALLWGSLREGDKSQDSNPIGGQAGEPITEGVLAGQSANGSTLEDGQLEDGHRENGHRERTNDAMQSELSVNESEQLESGGTVPDGSAEGNGDLAGKPQLESQLEPEGISSGKTKVEQNEATLALVPNRQPSVAGGSQGDPLFGDPLFSGPLFGGPGTAGGLDLDSTKGMNPFVGEGKPAASTVFVIDVSGSMWMSNSVPRVMNALNRAIDQLGEKQTFCVLLFDQVYYTAPFAPGMITGERVNKQRMKQWLSQPPGGDGTDPMAAMAKAIGYKPERIVLLSDGEFDPTYVTTITAMNKKRGPSARIDCVGLREDVEVLRNIADQNQGKYYQAW